MSQIDFLDENQTWVKYDYYKFKSILLVKQQSTIFRLMVNSYSLKIHKTNLNVKIQKCRNDHKSTLINYVKVIKKN